MPQWILKSRILLLFLLACCLVPARSPAQEPWQYQPNSDIQFPLPDSLISPYLCTVDRGNNLWVISSSAATPNVKNALFKAAAGDSQFALVADYSTDLNIESVRGIAAVGDTIYVSARKPGTPTPSLAILYEYPDGDVGQRRDYAGAGYGTWVLGIDANQAGYIYAGISYRTSIRIYDYTPTATTRGAWMPIQPIESHPSEPGGHDGTGQSIIRDVAVIPGADYTLTNTPFFTSRNSDSTGARGGIAIWSGGRQTDPKGYGGQRITDVAADLSWLWWTPYGLTADRAGNLYVCGTDTTRRWVKSFSILGTFAIELEELPGLFSHSSPKAAGAPMLAPSDIALSTDEQIAYVIDNGAKKAFVFRRGQVEVKDTGVKTITGFRLEGNYPNPFNAATTIQYQIPYATWVKIEIFDLTGSKVDDLVNSFQAAGRHRIQFDADNLPSGTYFYRIRAGQLSALHKMLLLK